MSLPLDPRLPDFALDRWPERLTKRLTELFRSWSGTLRPYIGPGWEDLRFPAQGINPSGAPTAASFDTTTYFGTLLFSGSAENHIAGVAQIPHSRLADSELRPHIHWTKTVADAGGLAVDWEFRYATAEIGGVISAYSAWENGVLVAGDNTSAEKHNLTAWSAVSPTTLGASDIILWNIRRNGNTDAYNEATRLLEFDFHYQIGSCGTITKQEYPV